MCLTQNTNVGTGKLDGVYSATRNVTKTQFDAFAYTGGYGDKVWIAVGYQTQWGIVYAEQGYIIVTLPLAYSSNKYVVIGQDLDCTNDDTGGYDNSVGVTQVTINSIRVSITKGRYLSYCTIGFQDTVGLC